MAFGRLKRLVKADVVCREISGPDDITVSAVHFPSMEAASKYS